MALKQRTNLGKILVVEDNIFMAELLAEKISNVGYEVITVYDGKEALEKISKEKLTLILLDMPLHGDIDGFQLLNQVRKSHDKVSLPVVVLFNLDQPEAISESLKKGANYYLVKALANTEEIVSKIEEILKSKNREIPIEKIPELPKVKTEAPKKPEDKKAMAPAEKITVNLEAPKRLKEKIDKMLTLPEEEISIIALVDTMMEYAFLARASDIHLEPTENKLIARLRIDGILHDLFNFPKGIQSGVITRIKVLGGMRTDEHQAAQDGRFRIAIANPLR